MTSTVKQQRMNTSLIVGGILILLTGFVSSAFAADGGGAQDKKSTAINFEDQLVEGELKKPELFYLLQKKQINFGRLIKLRDNFVPEMRRTSEELQRGRSQP